MLQTLRDLSGYVRRYPRPYVLGLTLLVAFAFFTTLAPLVIGRAIDAFLTGTMTMTSIWGYIGALLAIGVGGAAAMIFTRRTLLNASWEIQFDIRRDLFTHFTRLDPSYYDDHRVGDLMARLTADLNAVRMLIGVAVFMGANTSLVLGFTLVRMFQLNAGLSLLTLAIVPFITLTFFILLRIIHRRYEKVQEQFSEVSAMAQENFSGIRVVKGFGIEHREVEDFKRLNDEFIRRNLALTKVDGPLFPLMELLFGMTISLLLLIGGRLVLGVGSELTIGQFSSFVFLFEGIQWPIIALGWIANLLQRGSTSWHRLRQILDVPSKVNDDRDTRVDVTDLRGDIEFRDVSVHMDGRPVLDRVSFRIPAGQAVGMTGRTGSGKTLIVKLIARLLDPHEGQVLIDGIDVRRIPVAVLRRRIGLVPQEPFLFSDSIAENIAYGVPEGDDPAALEARVRAVARLAQLEKDVDDFPLGFATPLGERGVTLSGGQRQRTAIARALIREPRVLIFDDALSAVDTQTEADILEGLRQAQQGRTTLVVAHRVSAFQHADRVLVLEDGRLVEDGDHDALVAKNGWYADIVRRQQLEQDLETA
ncbi:MAG TPA: ABC transporter ATP-binding protein [Pseudomonadales bacterium]|nr:ABC transporter ATP-binding protein [Pseudomonadales bacterium]